MNTKQYIIGRTIMWSGGCIFGAVLLVTSHDLAPRFGALVLAALAMGFIWQGVHWYTERNKS